MLDKNFFKRTKYYKYVPIASIIFSVVLFFILWRPLNINKISYFLQNKDAIQTVPTKDEFELLKSVATSYDDENYPPLSDDEPESDKELKDQVLISANNNSSITAKKRSTSETEQIDTEFIEYPDAEMEGPDEKRNQGNIEYVVEDGDNLIKILGHYNVAMSDAYSLIHKYKNLSNIRAGQKLNIKLDDNNNLMQLEFIPGKMTSYLYERRDGSFVESVVESRGEWQNVLFNGVIDSNFSVDGIKNGLTAKEIDKITRTLQWQVNFGRLRKGATFSVIFSREMLDDSHQNSELQAIYIKNGSDVYTAFLASNGNYYDENGNAVKKGFRDFPLEKRARISSPFNPQRRHPITHQTSPHNGTDYAVSIGTPVLAPGDGEVLVAQYSPSAGYYITLKHNGEYKTRFMHLSKLLVKVGDHVTKDQLIAKSGNSGRSTGPHLHYELYINGKAVNSVTAKLPKAIGLSGKGKTAFIKTVEDYKETMNLK